MAWGAASILGVPAFMAEEAPAEVAPPLRLGALLAVALYAFAAWHFLRLLARRGRPLLLAIVVALVLLAEAMVTVVFSRDWHLSWWEWHLLMAIAFGAVAFAARIEYRREGSLTGAFGGLYLSGHPRAAASMACRSPLRPRFGAGRGPIDGRILDRLRIDGATTEELALLERAGAELRRVDELFRPYVPQQFVDRARADPGQARLGSGEEREVTVLFADLSGFTSYSERHAPTEVVELLNAVWTAAVPVVAAEDGLIENFTGDGLLVIFNAVGDQPDHAQRAARVALGLRDAIEALGTQRPEEMPRFHIGINTGPAFVGSVGAAGRRSFGAIGDTTNLGSRLLGAAGPGEIVVGEATWARLGGIVGGVPLEPLRLKGKREPVRAWRLER